jgi:hypothetical protein
MRVAGHIANDGFQLGVQRGCGVICLVVFQIIDAVTDGRIGIVKRGNGFHLQ